MMIHSQKKQAKNKMINITMLATLILILSITFASANDWTLYGGSPTVNSITTVRTNNNNAMAIDNQFKIYLYDSGVWNEINKPARPNGTQRADFDIAEDNKFYWVFSNETDNMIYNYDTSTQTWNYLETDILSNNGGGGVTVACIKEGNGYNISNTHECWYTRATADTVIRQIQGTTDIAIPAGSYGYIYAVRRLNFQTNSFNWYNYNGVSFSNLPSAVHYQELTNEIRYSGDNAPVQTLHRWNITSNTFSVVTYNLGEGFASGNKLIINPITEGVYGKQSTAGSTTKIGSISDYFDRTILDDIDIGSATITDGHIDEQSGTGWIGLSNGNFLEYDAGITPPSQYFTVTTTPTSNPTVYGTTTTFDAFAENNYGTNANITVIAYNSTGGLVDGVTCYISFGIISPLTALCQLPVTGSGWTYYEIGQNYTINTTFTDGTHTAKNSFVWSVIANATNNVTNYNVTQYVTSRNYTGIVALDNIGDNNIYAVGKTEDEIKIISFGVTNPNNMIIKTKNVTKLPFNFFWYASNPTSISIGNNDRIFLGTDTGVYTFNNTAYGDASQIIQEPNLITFSGFIQYTYDIDAIDENYAWACQDTGSDDVNLINFTGNNIATNIGVNPCYTVIKDPNRDLLFVDRGTSGINIYNTTTNTLITTITGILSQPSGATHDRISLTGTDLFAIGKTDTIYKYSTTNPASPFITAQCFSGLYDILSLEAIDGDTAIIGTTSGIRVCDFNASETFDQVNQYFVSRNLKTYQNNETPAEIITLDANNYKFAVAETNGIGIYYYTKSINQVSTNNPPSISTISLPTGTTCTDQEFQATIQATDPENDDLTYDYDCAGIRVTKLNNYISNTFTCSYSSAGTKTIKAFASDDNSIVSKTQNIVITACNASKTLSFRVVDRNTGQPISGVIVNVIGYTSGTTDISGNVIFQMTNAGTYSVSFSKASNPAYLSVTNNYATMSGIHSVAMESTIDPETGESLNQLIVIMTDANNLPIQSATISVTDPLTGISKTAYTDSTGTANFLDLATGVQLLVGASKSTYSGGCAQAGEGTINNPFTFDCSNVIKTTGSNTNYVNTMIGIGEVKTIYLTLSLTAINQSSGRGCQDYIKGVVLCSPLNISGTGDHCNNDADCITGRCEPAPQNTCSKFNWTICDAKGMERGNTCFNQAMIGAGGFNLSNWIISNFLFVLAFIAVTIFIMMIIKSVKN